MASPCAELWPGGMREDIGHWGTGLNGKPVCESKNKAAHPRDLALPALCSLRFVSSAAGCKSERKTVS